MSKIMENFFEGVTEILKDYEFLDNENDEIIYKLKDLGVPVEIGFIFENGRMSVFRRGEAKDELINEILRYIVIETRYEVTKRTEKRMRERENNHDFLKNKIINIECLISNAIASKNIDAKKFERVVNLLTEINDRLK